MNARWTIAVGSCACAAAAVHLFAANPAVGGYPQCLLYETTGYYCAGCGATRAMYALLHGRMLDALHDNLLFVTLLPVVLAFVLPFAARAWRANRWPAVYLTQRAVAMRGVGMFFIALLFMAARNMPGAGFDWLRPLA